MDVWTGGVDDTDIRQFRQRLLNLQAELQAVRAASEEARGTVKLDQTSVGRLSRMDALQGQAMSQEQERRRELELKKIAAALRRIESGEYGDCLRCGEAIAAARLELDPAATLCIDCASAAES